MTIDLTAAQCRTVAELIRSSIIAKIRCGAVKEDEAAYTVLCELVTSEQALVRAADAAEAPKPPPAQAAQKKMSRRPAHADNFVAFNGSTGERPNATAARIKRDTLERLKRFRAERGLGCLDELAAACGGDVTDTTLRGMLESGKYHVDIWRHVAAGLDKLTNEKEETKNGTEETR